jgi:hypothetical protein
VFYCFPKQYIFIFLQTFHSSFILSFRSVRIRWPRSGLATGSAIHCSIAGGIQAGSTGSDHVAGSLFLNPCRRPLESSSASTAPVSERRVIFSMLTVAPRARQCGLWLPRVWYRANMRSCTLSARWLLIRHYQPRSGLACCDRYLNRWQGR